jgi:HSP20 family protein
MRSATIEVMHEQVRTIYRALTGGDLGDGHSNGIDDASAEQQAPGDDEVERRFAELDALARQHGMLGERVPPFSFTPLVDVFDIGRDLLVEVAVPGVEREDIDVVATEHDVVITGVRRGERVSRDRSYLHAEIPRGPFSRTIRLPDAVEPRAQIDVRGGVILIRLQKI